MATVTSRFSLSGYEGAKSEATDRIIKKQSRGSVSAQNGWFMSREKLRKKSLEADVHIINLRKMLKK